MHSKVDDGYFPYNDAAYDGEYIWHQGAKTPHGVGEWYDFYESHFGEWWYGKRHGIGRWTIGKNAIAGNEVEVVRQKYEGNWVNDVKVGDFQVTKYFKNLETGATSAPTQRWSHKYDLTKPKFVIEKQRKVGKAILFGHATKGLSSVPEDIESARNFLRKKDFKVKEKIESNLTKVDVIEQLTHIFEEMKQLPYILFYFTGHGNNGKMDMYGRGVEVDEWLTVIEIIELFIKCTPDSTSEDTHLILVIDSCKSASAVKQVKKWYDTDKPKEYKGHISIQSAATKTTDGTKFSKVFYPDKDVTASARKVFNELKPVSWSSNRKHCPLELHGFLND